MINDSLHGGLMQALVFKSQQIFGCRRKATPLAIFAVTAEISDTAIKDLK